MTNQQQFGENNPRHYSGNIKAMLRDVTQHVREDAGKVSDSKARALFEVTAEGLGGHLKAYDDFEQKAEEAWRQAARPQCSGAGM